MRNVLNLTSPPRGDWRCEMAVGVPGIGYGAEIGYGNGATPEVFTKVARVVDISGPEFSLESVDVTNQDSTGAFEEDIPGIVKGGEISFDVILVEAATTQVQLQTDILARTKRNWRVKKPGGHGYSFPGFVTKLAEAVPYADKMTYSFTLKVAGVPTLVTP